MQMTTLGRTGLEVSVAGLGGGGHSRLGQATGKTRDESVALVRRAIELGVRFVDTAFVYGTEAIVGEAIRASGEEVVVSTKCALTRDDRLIRGDELMRFAEKSLGRTGLETLDVYNLHGVTLESYEHCREELCPALIRLREQGKIRFPGITEAFVRDPSHRMLDRALDDDFFDVVMVGYNLLNPSASPSVLTRTAKAGVGTQIMFAVRRALSRPEVLADVVEGLVADGLVDAAELPAARRLDFLLRDAGSLVEAAYRFCRHSAGVDVVLTGTGEIAHLEENLRFIQGPPLPAESLARLQAIFGRVDTISGN